jgi:uncharacterized protein YndB with AHSA1/START domain
MVFGALNITTPTAREIEMTRVFHAPRTLVYEALTTPELVRRWLLGPPGWSMPVCEIDLRVGGRYRYLWRKDGGTEMGLSGVFREVLAPERIVQTEVFDSAWYEGEALVTSVLTERDGKTTLTLTLQYQSEEVRNAVLKSGMERGVGASYDRLEELLAAKVGA